MTDIILNKKESIERCIIQVRNYYSMPSTIPFHEDYMKQDAIAINLQRACEQAIDLANHVIRKLKLGLPKESRDSFSILSEKGIIPSDMAKKLRAMVGFRNTLVHQYQRLDVDIMKSVIENDMDDLIAFTTHIMQAVQKK